ncbi:Igfbp7 [Phodopus roborovskii]|uniref:Igfbp7 protein n=1 Tax=Phodopus roborovskii TaxID=109678 RepID=A0AAU9ZUK6_PHORO|nr:Igfbp7 [Phodopus roborovskii]
MERLPRALLLGAAGLLLLLLPLSSSSSSDACGPCVPASCPALPPLGCPLGETRDECGCCPVCARGEGEPCGGGAAGRGHCAPGMECVKSRKRRKGKAGAAAGGPAVLAVCVCKSRYPVCGSDGTTYPSGCQLRAASLRAESRGEKAITQVSKGTCEQGGHRRIPRHSLLPPLPHPPPLQSIPGDPREGGVDSRPPGVPSQGKRLQALFGWFYLEFIVCAKKVKNRSNGCKYRKDFPRPRAPLSTQFTQLRAGRAILESLYTLGSPGLASRIVIEACHREPERIESCQSTFQGFLTCRMGLQLSLSHRVL